MSVRLSARPPFRLFVRFRCFVQTNEHTIVRFTASGRTILVVSEDVNFIRVYAESHPWQGRKREALSDR